VSGGRGGVVGGSSRSAGTPRLRSDGPDQQRPGGGGGGGGGATSVGVG